MYTQRLPSAGSEDNIAFWIYRAVSCVILIMLYCPGTPKNDSVRFAPPFPALRPIYEQMQKACPLMRKRHPRSNPIPSIEA